MTTDISKPANFSLSGFIKLTRFWNLVIIALAQYSTAIFLLGGFNIIYNKDLFILSLSTVIIAAAGYIINDYYDVKIDLINKPKRVVIGRVLKRRVAMILHTTLNFIGIGLGLFLSVEVAMLNFVSAVFLWAYSNQFKRMVLIGNLLVAFLTGLSIYIVGFHFDPFNSYVIAYSMFAFFVTLIREIIKDLEDLKGDSTFGCRTLPVAYGLRTTKMVIYIVTGLLLISLSVLFYFFIDEYMTIMCLSLIIPFGFLFYKLSKADTVREFNYLSNYCKFVMLAGITSMILFL